MARGHNAERRTAAALRAAGYLVASRRHEGGAGDILAWTPQIAPSRGSRALVEVPPLLVEVKNTRQPFEHFRLPDRRALLLAQEDYGVEPLLCWWPPGTSLGPFWIPPEEWPASD